MSINSDRVKIWREETKNRIVKAMGGKCQICGYNKCNTALALHHINPNEKEFSFGAIRANCKSWDTIVVELRKCVLLCQNCHSELHADFVSLPEKYDSFNEEYSDYKKHKFVLENECPVCKTLKNKKQQTCSVECSKKFFSPIKWENYDLAEMIKTKSVLAISRIIGCSDVSVHKRLKKLGLKNKKPAIKQKVPSSNLGEIAKIKC